MVFYSLFYWIFLSFLPTHTTLENLELFGLLLARTAIFGMLGLTIYKYMRVVQEDNIVWDSSNEYGFDMHLIYASKCD